MFEENIEQKIESNKKKIELHQLRFERLEKGFEQIYKEINITPEDLSEYLNNCTNFSTEVWNRLEEFRAELDHKLKKELENVQNLAKTANAYSERKNIRPTWIYVR
jgi:septal ring factor EnvC (AmiA/AmiB activator)